MKRVFRSLIAIALALSGLLFVVPSASASVVPNATTYRGGCAMVAVKNSFSSCSFSTWSSALAVPNLIGIVNWEVNCVPIVVDTRADTPYVSGGLWYVTIQVFNTSTFADCSSTWRAGMVNGS